MLDKHMIVTTMLLRNYQIQLENMSNYQIQLEKKEHHIRKHTIHNGKKKKKLKEEKQQK